MTVPPDCRNIVGMFKSQRIFDAALNPGLLALAGCQAPPHTLAKATSPGGTKVAYLLEEDSVPLVSTGSTVEVSTVVRPPNHNADLVFRGDDMNGRGFGPVNIMWMSNELLSIGYCSGRISIFRNDWVDAQAQQSNPIEIVLEREPPGQWPKTVPVNRRGPTPPCQ